MRIVTTVVASAIALFASNASDHTAEFDAPTEYRFLVIGDWGRSGQAAQWSVARAMGEYNAAFHAQAIVSTGDNFYCCGVASIDDPQWMSSFENVYRHHTLHVDWYPVVGNHDYRGSVQAEIDYSRKSRRWRMRDRYYAVNTTAPDGTRILFAFIDTNPFITAYRLHADEFSDLLSQDTAQQLAWLDSMLAHSDAAWKIVVGHHPVYSSFTAEGDPRPLSSHLLPQFERWGVDCYLCGHEHNLQHAHVEGKRLHQFISGAGAEAWPADSLPATRFQSDVPGFLAVSVTRENIEVRVIDEEGEELYQAVVKR